MPKRCRARQLVMSCKDFLKGWLRFSCSGARKTSPNAFPLPSGAGILNPRGPAWHPAGSAAWGPRPGVAPLARAEGVAGRNAVGLAISGGEPAGAPEPPPVGDGRDGEPVARASPLEVLVSMVKPNPAQVTVVVAVDAHARQKNHTRKRTHQRFAIRLYPLGSVRMTDSFTTLLVAKSG